MPEQTTVTIFYAWQSDLAEKFNHFAIKQALALAAAKLTTDALTKGQSVTFVIDDATRGMVGSSNIPTSIMQKIQAADFFVGDVSAINAAQDDTKMTPNPNVVFELGFAAAHLGWERTLILINTTLGGSPHDMPFDFDKHRAATYESVEGQGWQQGLNKLVWKALTAMVEKDAPRPTANIFNEAAAQRDRDLTNLRWLLRAVHLPTLDDHLTSSVKRLSAASAYFSEITMNIAGSSQFHLYDEELGLAVRVLVEKWAESTNADDYFSDHPDPKYFLYISSNGPERAATLEQIRDELKIALGHLIKIIRTRFPEINLDETSQDALLRYERHLAAVAED